MLALTRGGDTKGFGRVHQVQTARTAASSGLLGSKRATASLRPTTISTAAMSRATGTALSQSYSEPVSCTSAFQFTPSHAFKMA